MNDMPYPKGNPLDTLIDLVKTKAFQRGVEKPDWSDVWTSIREVPAFYQVLSDRGVSVGDFVADIHFLQRVGGKDLVLGAGNGAEPMSVTVEKARQELIDELLRVEDDLTVRLDEQKKNLLQIFVTSVQMNIMQAHPVQSREHVEVKMMLLEQALTHLLKNADIKGPNGEKSFSEAGIPLPLVAGQIARMLMSPMPFMEADVVATLESLKPMIPLQQVSPVDVVEKMRLLSGDVYEKLMFRNGYFSTDPDRQDTLAEQFPDEYVRNLASQALSNAYHSKCRVVDKRHVVQALLSDRGVQIILNKLKMQDQLKFQGKFAEIAYEKENEAAGNMHFHPAMTDDFRALVWKLDGQVKQMEKDEVEEEMRGPELLRGFFTEDKEVDTALNKAGLLRRISRSWRAAYDEDWKPKKGKKGKKSKKDKDKEKKKKAEFEVSDAELEECIKGYCIDYTALAKAKKFDPMIGMDEEMGKVVTTLLKRGKKNPVTIGEPGVGKSKILEGLAQRIVAGRVPEKLVGARLILLDLHSMDDSPWKGMFESRILPILKGAAERNASGKCAPIMVGIEELASSMDAGAHSAGDGIKGMIKPYLAAGDLFVIANTTTKEYQNKVQKDSALARRFNPVTINEPTVEQTAEILRQLKPRYARHHKVRIPDGLLLDVASLGGRYISTNQPDKSIDLLDFSCAIAARDGEKALTRRHLVEAVSNMTAIPAEFLNSDDEERYRTLPEKLNEAVLEQPEAVAAVASALQRSKAGLSDPNRPLGTFLFVGPTGVGKTELTKALARLLFGSEKTGFLRYDMSEYQEKHDVARFIGAPAGYVGFEEGGKLVNDINAHPFSVVLFDEIEKAHPDVVNALLSPFDSGDVTDGRGRKANMRNTVDILTSNLGARAVQEEGERLGLDPIKDFDKWQEMARPIYEAAVRHHFRPEFINRLDGIIYFNSLGQATIDRLVDRRIGETAERLQKVQGLTIDLSEEFRQAIVRQGFDVRFGARPLARAVKDMLESPLSAFLLSASKKERAAAEKVVVSYSAANDAVATKPVFELRQR